MTDNTIRQAEEIEALCSIYGDEWRIEGDSSYSIQIKEGSHAVTLYIELPDGYPSDSPPVYQLLAPELSGEMKKNVAASLDEVYLDNVGEAVIYQWIEKVREVLLEPVVPEEEISVEETEDVNEQVFVATPAFDYELPQIYHGETIIDRKSVFQGHAAHIIVVEQVKQVIQKLYENKKIANATHNIFAYRIFKDDTKSYIQDCEDDGETQAGGRLLHLLQILDLKNVLVVVTRWYGGILLGPDRFRHINNAARQVLDSAGFIVHSEQQQHHHSGKKKK